MTRFRRRRPARRSRLRSFLVSLLSLTGIALAAIAVQMLATRTLEGPITVADGDSGTIGTVRVRLEGIDAPEFNQLCRDARGAQFDCGRRARDHLRQLIAGRPDTACSGFETDRFGRLLVTCTASGLARSLNGQMVHDGWALAFGAHDWLESDARAAKRGLWAGTFERPRDVRERSNGATGDLAGGVGSLLRRLRSMVGAGGHLE